MSVGLQKYERTRPNFWVLLSVNSSFLALATGLEKPKQRTFPHRKWHLKSLKSKLLAEIHRNGDLCACESQRSSGGINSGSLTHAIHLSVFLQLSDSAQTHPLPNTDAHCLLLVFYFCSYLNLSDQGRELGCF